VSSPRPAADAAFRVEVAELRRAERARAFPLRVHVGCPGGARRQLEVPWPVPPDYDAGLRFDVLDALVDALLADRGADGPTWGWLTRPGQPVVHDHDLGWFAAAHRALGARDLAPAGFRVVTRTGWLDVGTGERRTWKRLRLR